MPLGEALENNDDYVISLLTRDAEANKKRYLTNGLGSLLPTSSRRSKDAPKPNTRFLRNIVRDADAHNAALKAKEEEESRARLRELRRGGKRGREEDGEGREEHRAKRSRGGKREGRWAGVLDGLGEKGKRAERRRVEVEDGRGDEEGSRHGHEPRRDRERGREDDPRRHKHDRTSTTTDERRHARPRDRRKRSESCSSSRSRSPRPAARPPRHDQPKEQADQDSDPLDDVIGPSPPPKILARGRGANKVASTIDTRFNPSYNPKTDVDLSPDEGGQDGERDDWDMALEALRDRAKWRVKGGDRLREAGFTEEEEVGKWEKNSGLVGSKDDGGGGEKGVEDVRWAKRGEGREWDRGKVVDGEGGVDVKASWGRLKDS